jgi:hypothetical protein
MKIVLTPDWFLGKDVMIDSFSFLVLLAFVILCWRSYKTKKNRGSLYLGVGFLSIALAQLASIMTKLVLYYDTTFIQQIGQVIVTSHVVESVDIFYKAGFFFSKFLTLLGLFVIYKIPDKKKRTIDFFIAVYLIILSALISSDMYYLYHLSVVLFLILIIGNFYSVYQKNKSTNTKILIIALGMLGSGNFIMLLAQVGMLFVLGNLIELASYLMLLFLAIRILRADKN